MANLFSTKRWSDETATTDHKGKDRAREIGIEVGSWIAVATLLLLFAWIMYVIIY